MVEITPAATVSATITPSIIQAAGGAVNRSHRLQSVCLKRARDEQTLLAEAVVCECSKSL